MQGRREAGPCSGGRVHVGMPGLWVVVEGWGVCLESVAGVGVTMELDAPSSC